MVPLGQTGVMADFEAVTTHGSTVDEWTRALAESTGSPGGGAGAGLMLAMAASLTSMVAGYTDAGPSRRDELDELHARARSLRVAALQLADEDASASKAFGAAFRLPPGAERDAEIHKASVEAAKTSAIVGERAIEAIPDLEWLADKGNPALIADVMVAFGALRAALTGARTNVSFDLSTSASAGRTLEQIRHEHPDLWASVQRLGAALDQIDRLTAEIDHRAVPTDSA